MLQTGWFCLVESTRQKQVKRAGISYVNILLYPLFYCIIIKKVL